jgi:hypothetical protein
VLPPLLLPSAAAAALAGGVAWLGYGWWSPSGKLGDVVALVTLSALALVLYYAVVRLFGVEVTRRLPRSGAAAS